MKKVYSHENLAMVQLSKDFLEANDIACFLKNEYHASGGHVGWETIPIELWVRNSDDSARALQLLDTQFQKQSEQTAWVCPVCQEENAGSFETCWKCQTERT